jgi:Fuc2NAc and GlcNAc transferase
VAAAAAGFLVLNWAPAKVFMGDAGSGLLGYVFAVLALASERGGSIPLALWIALLGVFFFDATVTLIRRMLRREAWYNAHRSHAYQRLVQSGWSHASVVIGCIAVNAVLGGLTAFACARPDLAVPALLIAVLILWGTYAAVGRRVAMYP